MRRAPIIALLLASAACAAATAPAHAVDEARRLIAAGRYEAAAAVLDAHLASRPRDPAALVLRGRVERDGARAQERFRAAIDADPRGPNAPAALLAVAEFAWASGQSANALRHAWQVIDGFPTSDEARRATLLVGRAQLSDLQFADAATTLRPLLDVREEDIRSAAIASWARAMAAAGKAGEAIRVLSAPARADDPAALAALARSYDSAHRTREATDVRTRADRLRAAWERRPLGASTAGDAAVARTSAVIPATAGSDSAFRGGARGWSLEIAATTDRRGADALAEKMRAKGIEAIVHRTGRLSRVWAGNWTTEVEARAARGDVERIAGREPVPVRNR